MDVVVALRTTFQNTNWPLGLLRANRCCCSRSTSGFYHCRNKIVTLLVILKCKWKIRISVYIQPLKCLFHYLSSVKRVYTESTQMIKFVNALLFWRQPQSKGGIFFRCHVIPPTNLWPVFFWRTANRAKINHLTLCNTKTIP